MKKFALFAAVLGTVGFFGASAFAGSNTCPDAGTPQCPMDKSCCAGN